MSALLENTKDDIDVLKGATIEKVWITKAVDAYSTPAVRLRVRFADDLLVNGETHGEYELWQDVEGNGPGYLAFMGAP